MGIPAGVTRCSLTGTFGGGDIFDVSFWCTGLGITSNTVATACASTLASAVTAAGAKGPIAAILDPGSAYTGASVYAYPTGGPNATYIGHAGVSSMPGTSAVNIPYQTALAATYLTGQSGRRFTGRSYLPASGLAFGGGQSNISSTLLSATLTGWVVMLNQFIATNPGAQVVVVSTAGSAATQVTQVRMDSKADIQRRRANRQHALTTAISAV